MYGRDHRAHLRRRKRMVVICKVPVNRKEIGTPEPEKNNPQPQGVGQRWLTAGIAIPIVLVFVWVWRLVFVRSYYVSRRARNI